jgi:hypothetical protein
MEPIQEAHVAEPALFSIDSEHAGDATEMAFQDAVARPETPMVYGRAEAGMVTCSMCGRGVWSLPRMSVSRWTASSSAAARPVM